MCLFSIPNISSDTDEESEEETELILPELDEKDEKCYEIVQQIIEGLVKISMAWMCFNFFSIQLSLNLQAIKDA